MARQSLMLLTVCIFLFLEVLQTNIAEVNAVLNSRMWGRRRHATGRVRWSTQSPNIQKTTSKTLPFVTQDPTTNSDMFTTTNSTTGNHGEINDINVIPSENASNANVNYTQGNIVGVIGVSVTPPANTTTQSNGCPTPGRNGIDIHVTPPPENIKQDGNAAGITNCVTHSSSPSHLTDSKADKLPNQHFLESQDCFMVSLDKENGELTYRNPSATMHDNIQDTLEVVLLSISVVAEISSLVLLTLIRSKMPTERIFVHKNLLISLALGHLVYVFDIQLVTSRSELTIICSIIAATKHYLHMTLYMWMLVEGINLFIKMVKVFTTGLKRKYLAYILLGWGIPAVILGIVAAINPFTYDMSVLLQEDIQCGSLQFTVTFDRDRCWINGSLWTFQGPNLVILLANLAVFSVVLRVSFGKISAKYGKRSLKAMKKGLKSIAALLPLLGITFLLGFFVHVHYAVGYVYILLNSIQGVLFFIFHCVFDDEVRDAVRKLCRKKWIPNPLQYKQQKKVNPEIHGG